MKPFIILCSAIYFWTAGVAGAEPLQRALNTYSDESTTGMELVAPAMYYVDVPPMTMMSVTVERMAGDCELRVKAGTGFTETNVFWAPVMSHVEGGIAGLVETAEIVVLPPSDTTRRIYLTFDSVGNRHCSYRTYVRGSDLLAKAGEAIAKTLALLIVESIISDIIGMEPGELAQNPLAERGMQAGIALLTSDDISDFTMAMMMNEIQIRVTRAIPGSHALAVWVTNTLQGVASDLFQPYFQARMN